MHKLHPTSGSKFQNFKCGEIYCETPVNYYASCSLCGKRILFEEFPDHFQKEHLSHKGSHQWKTMNSLEDVDCAGNITPPLNIESSDIKSKHDVESIPCPLAQLEDEKPIDLLEVQLPEHDEERKNVVFENLPTESNTGIQYSNRELNANFERQYGVNFTRTHDSSGFDDGQKNYSDKIPSSPEFATAKYARRLMQQEGKILTSTPNFASSQMKGNPKSSTAPLLPLDISKTTKTSLNTNTSSFCDKSGDSFCIPETQQCKQQKYIYINTDQIANERIANANRRSKNQSEMESDEEFCIPETQEPTSSSRTKIQNLADANQKVVDENLSEKKHNSNSSSSQFRICTIDFNDIGFGEEENDILSLVIPCIKHNSVEVRESVELNNNENGEKNDESVLNWLEDDSKNDKLVFEETERGFACTPDLFDLPELAQTNLGLNLNTSINDQEKFTKKIENSSEKATINYNPEPALFEGKDELLPTQVFSKTERSKNIPINIKDSPVYLTLSDKENLLPSISAALVPENELQPTQLSTISNQSLSNLSHEGDKSKVLSPSDVSSTPIEEPFQRGAELEELLPATQVFLEEKTKANEKPSSSKSILSPPLACTESFEKVSLISTEIFENTSRKKEEDEFLKPIGVVSKKSSTLSNVSSMSERSEIDMLMCTPQIIVDNFYQPDINSKARLIAKQKSLFGEDSDEEEIDVLQLITKPKISHDFDKLLPHLKKKLSPNREQEESKLENYNRAFFSRKEKESSGRAKITPNRNERHAALCKTRSKEQEIFPNKLDDNEKKSRVKRKKIEPRDINASLKPPERKKNKVDSSNEYSEQNSKSVSFSPEQQIKQNNVESDIKIISKKSKKTKIESGYSGKRLDQNETMSSQKCIPSRVTRSRSQSQTKEPETLEKPLKRVTRLKSIMEDGKMNAEETESKKRKSMTVKSNKKSNTAKRDINTGPSNDSGKITCCSSVQSNSSLSTAATEIKPPRNRSPQGDPHTTISSATSSVPSTCHKPNNKLLKVSMTMVDPELFDNLSKNSAGFWTIAEDPNECDILIMDKGNRTFKFLIAMAKGIPVVTSSWLDSLNKTREMTDISRYFFKDEAFERRHKFSIVKTVELARKQKLFQGYSFLMTPNIRPQIDEMEVIIKCAGGTVLKHLASSEINSGNLYLISTKDEQKLWHKYRRINKNIRIISSEGVMSSIMRQTVKSLDSNLIG